MSGIVLIPAPSAGGGGGVSDHGALSGLADDDHDQYVLDTLANANSVLYAVTDDVPAALAMAASTILARLASGDIIAATTAQVKTLLALAAGDVSGLGALATLSTVGTTQITDGAVTTAKQANAAANSLRGNNTGSAAVPADLSVAQAKALLAIAQSDVSGLTAALALLAPLASPALTGSPTVNGALVAARQVVAVSSSDVTAVNTAAETTVADLTLPGGSVSAGDIVRLTVMGDSLNNSGAGVTFLFKFKFGTTTVLATTGISIGAGANRRMARATVDILMESTTAQRVSGMLWTATQASNTWQVQSGASQWCGYGTAAENTVTDKAVQLSVTMGTAVSTADFVVHGATLEIIRKR